MNLQKDQIHIAFVKLFVWAVLAGGCSFFVWYIWQYAINIPHFDDFRTVSILNRINEHPEELWTQLFQNFNGHRLGVPFGLAWLNILFEGTLRLDFLMIVGALFYLGMLAILARLVVQAGVSEVYLLPLALLILHPLAHRNLLWATSTLQYMGSTFLTCLLFYLLIWYRSLGHFVAALLVGTMLPYTNGNGVYILVLGGLFLLFTAQLKRAIGWGGGVLVLSVIVYWEMPTVVGLAGYSAEEAEWVQKVVNVIRSVLSFLGSSVISFRAELGDTIVLGGSILAFFIWAGLNWLRQKPWSDTDVWAGSPSKLSYTIVLFIGASVLMTAVGVGVSRGMNKETMVVDRYLVYSVWILACTYILITLRMGPKWRTYWLGIALAGSLFFNQYLYWYYTPEVAWWRQSFVADGFNLKYNEAVQGKLFPFGTDGPEALRKALASGLYRYPTTELNPLEEQIRRPVETSGGEIDSTLRFEVRSGMLNVYGGVRIDSVFLASSIRPASDIGEGTYLILKEENNRRTYLAAPEWYRWKGYTPFLARKKLYRGGFVATLFQGNIIQGRYRLGLLTLAKEGVSLRFSGQFIEVQDSSLLELLRQQGYYTR